MEPQKTPLQIAESHKQKGNDALKANDFDKAIDHYSDAINLGTAQQDFSKDKLAIYYANRSFSNIKLENYRLSMGDAEEAIKMNPNYEKAYLRLAFSCEITQKYKEAYAAYKKVQI